jgi:hypothetical protein
LADGIIVALIIRLVIVRLGYAARAVPNDGADDGHQAPGNEHGLQVEGACYLLERSDLDVGARFGSRERRLADSKLLAQLGLA